MKNRKNEEYVKKKKLLVKGFHVLVRDYKSSCFTMACGCISRYISYLKIPLRCVLIAFVHDILMNSLNITIEFFLKRTRTLGLVSSRGF